MRLLITTPMAMVIDEEDVSSIRAQDETGTFGILPGHAAFLTVLAVSVLTWHDRQGREHNVAVRGGVLEVRDGLTRVATREAVGEETLQRLGEAVLERMRSDQQEDETARLSAARLNVAAIRQLQRYLEAGRGGGFGGASQSYPHLEAEGEE